VDLDLAAERLPIFPLPRVVLMPRDLLPLHVYEPRYRALVAHCVQNDLPMGIATLKPGWEADYEMRPPVWPEIGIGRIAGYRLLKDGRSNIVLQWLARGWIEGEYPEEKIFREVRARVLSDVGADAPLTTLRALVLQLGAYGEQQAEEARRIAALEGSELVDALARKLLDDPDDRRRYVAIDSVPRRAALLEEKLAMLVGGGNPVGDA
jgi:Lon protease-like protein